MFTNTINGKSYRTIEEVLADPEIMAALKAAAVRNADAQARIKAEDDARTRDGN